MIYLMTLCYNSLELIEQGLAHHNSMNDLAEPHLHLMVDPQFPIVPRETMRPALQRLAVTYDSRYLEIPNHGVAGNWEQVRNALQMRDDDILIGLDPDERPDRRGWMSAVVTALRADPAAYYVGLSHAGCDRAWYEQACGGQKVKEVCLNGVWAFEFPQLVSWPVGGFSVRWALRVGGFHAENNHYGYFEHEMHNRCAPLGGKFYLLRDFKNTHTTSNLPELQEWKNWCANNYRRDMSFEQWRVSRK